MNAVSMPPLSSEKPPKPVTFADVAMRVAQDGPIYAIIGLVGAMALGGHATASEAVITGLAGLLARMWPQAVQVAGKTGAMLLPFVASAMAFSAVYACTPAQTQAEIANASYKAQQLACVDKYKPDRAAIDKCRDDVKHEWANDAGTDGAK